MNKKGEVGFTGKILIGLLLAVMILSTTNAFFIGITVVSLIKMISFNSILIMRGIYLTTGISTLIAAIILFIKVYIQKE